MSRTPGKCSSRPGVVPRTSLRLNGGGGSRPMPAMNNLGGLLHGRAVPRTSPRLNAGIGPRPTRATPTDHRRCRQLRLPCTGSVCGRWNPSVRVKQEGFRVNSSGREALPSSCSLDPWVARTVVYPRTRQGVEHAAWGAESALARPWADRGSWLYPPPLLSDAGLYLPDGPSRSPRGRVGIACSGGGIRAAAFSLGALQVLQAHGLPRRGL